MKHRADWRDDNRTVGALFERGWSALTTLTAWMLTAFLSIFFFNATAHAISVGQTVDNSVRIDWTRIISGDSIAFSTTSNTVTAKVELGSRVDVIADIDSQYIRSDSTYAFAKRIQNLGNGTDTFVLRADSTFGLVLGFFFDANADSKIDTSVDPAVSTIVLGEGQETTVFVLVRLPSGVADRQVDTISVGAHSKDTDPSSDTAKLVLTVDVAPPSEVLLRTPSDSATIRITSPSLLWDTTTDTGSGLSIYSIELSDVADTDFTDTVRGTYLSDTTWTVSPSLPKGSYRWRVRATDKVGNVTVGVDSRTFTIDTSFLISLSSPSADSTTGDSTPTFLWTGDGETFYIQIARDSAFTLMTETATTLVKTYTSIGLADTAYFWRVAGIDSLALSGTSAIRGLTVAATQIVVDTGPGRILVTGNVTQPSSLTVQELDTAAVAVFAIGADTKEAVRVSRVRLTHVGGMSSTRVTAVKIYLDANTNAALDSTDTLFASGTFSGDTVDLAGTAFQIASSDTANLLVVYQTTSGLTENDTFFVRIAAATDMTCSGVISESVPVVTLTSADGKIVTVRTRYPTVVSVTPVDSSIFLPPHEETGVLPITIKFSVPIDSTTLTANSIRLLDASGVNRTDTIVAIDSVTLKVKATYADTAWPYGTAFKIVVTTSVRDIDVPADSIQAEYVTTFQTFANSQAEQSKVSTDSMATLEIDSGDIDPSVKGIVTTVEVPKSTDTVMAQAMNSVKADPFLEGLPDDLAVYDYKIRKRDTNDTRALVKLNTGDFLKPVDVKITVRKPSGYLESRNGTPLNFRLLKLGHFNETTLKWEILEGATITDHGNTVTIAAPTKEFSLYGVFFAFAPTSGKETFRSFPNPFDPFTTYTNNSGQSWQGIQFAWNMPKAGSATIKIYDFAGQLVRVLGPTTFAAGNYFGDNTTITSRTWDGKNGRGQTVLNGAYFVFVEFRYTDGSVETATDRIAVVK